MIKKTNNNRYPLVCFDLDGTLVDDTIYIWKTLHETFDTDARIRRRAFDDFFAGRISYAQWFDTDLRLLREAGATRERIVEVVGALRLMDGAREVVHALKESGRKLAIISGSLDIVLDTLWPDAPFDHILINRIAFDVHGRICGGTPTPYDLQNKATGLHHLCAAEALHPTQAAFIGDNENDIHIAQAAGLSIAFNCKSQKLERVADVVVEGRDLRAVLPHL